MSIKIAVFDDNKDRRESLEYLIRMHDDFDFVGAFESCILIDQKIKEL